MKSKNNSQFDIFNLFTKKENIILLNITKEHFLLLLIFICIFYFINTRIKIKKDFVYIFEIVILFLFFISNVHVKIIILILSSLCVVTFLIFELYERYFNTSSIKNKKEGLKIIVENEQFNHNKDNDDDNDLVTFKTYININENDLYKQINEDTILDKTEEKYSSNPTNFAYYDLPIANIKTNTAYTAVIIEPRKHKALEFVLNNFLENLDNKWSIIIIHGNSNSFYLKNIIEKRLYSYKNRIQTINMNVDNLSVKEYSELFYNRKFYDYIPTETFLVFQTDSMILKENRDKLYNFIDYDYVGAPWIESVYGPMGVGNGGLSLRKKSKMIELLKYKKIARIEKINDEYGEYIAEDRFFCGYYTDHIYNIKKPTIDEATNFSVEAIYNNKPFGIHKCWYHLSPNELNKLVSYYPKIKILINYNNKSI
jgi:hypothetical protein